MRVSHPSDFYIRKSPHKEIWMMCDADDADEIKKVDFSTQYNSKGVILPNTPVRGLKVLGTPSDAKNLWVDIEDPRGFVVRVRLEHYWNLIKTSQSETGEILDPCVWMIQGPYAVPMSLHSADYLKHVKLEYLQSRRIKLRNLKRGHTVTLQDGSEVIYLGLFRLVPLARDMSYRTKSFTLGNVIKRYLYYNVKEECLQASTTLDVSEVVDNSTMTLEEAHEFVHSKPFTQRAWELSQIAYMAPVKFNSDELKIEIIEETLTQEMVLTRTLTFFNPSTFSPYYKLTDWRNPRRQFDYVKSLNESTLFLNMAVSSTSPFRLTMETNGAFEVGAPPSKTASFMKVSVGDRFPALLSGRLPR